MLRPADEFEATMSLIRQLTTGNTIGIHIRHGTDKFAQSHGVQPVSAYIPSGQLTVIPTPMS